MEKDCTVFSNGQYTLGQKNGLPFVRIGGREYTLTCHPYEPCLYVADETANVTAVHNSFDPSAVLEIFSEGGKVTSITGREYTAIDFCRMVEYAAGKIDIQIDEAEKCLGVFTKKKNPEPEKKAEFAPDEEALSTELERVIEDGAFDDVIKRYPESVVDFCLVKNVGGATGYNAHRSALLCASMELFADADDSEAWRFDPGKATAKEIPASDIFAHLGDAAGMNYRKAFLNPPIPNGYTDKDFAKVNAALFPNGTEGLEVYEWSTDWSEYFDEGHEWWGAFCLTVYDRTLERFAVIMASATD